MLVIAKCLYLLIKRLNNSWSHLMACKDMQKPENCFIPIMISQASTLILEPPKNDYLPLHKQVQN